MMKAEREPASGVFGGAQGKAEAGGEVATVRREDIRGRGAQSVRWWIERWQGIDEAKEVGLEGGIAHGPVEQKPLPISGLEKARLPALKLLIKATTQPLDIVFEEDFVRSGEVRQFRGEIHAKGR